MNQRAYSFVELKALDTEQRLIEGWASRPEVDRQGDIMEPLGMEVGKQMPPLLLDHNHKSAVGTIESLTPTKDGVRFRARIAKIATPGPLKDLVDSAWEMCLAGLRRAVSIGFLPDLSQADPLPTGGRRYRKWSLLELSLVSVPACAGATIDTVKSYDRELLRKRAPVRVVRLDTPVAPRKALPVVRLSGAPRTAAHLDSVTETRPVAEAMLKALEEAEERDREAEERRKLGIHGQTIELMTAGAKATDAELAALRARLDRLEGKS
jgi:hypothetical protein